jgi:serine/threonine protein kinase/Tfp pilus assembly protein PilF
MNSSLPEFNLIEKVGTIIDDQYQLLEPLGRGGMSVVYEANDLLLQRRVAVKLLLPHLATCANRVLRFQQEALAVSKLSHPNIVTIHDFGLTHLGIPYIVMERVCGKSLASILNSERRLATERAVNIFIQVASAIEHAHANRVIHRDLKPSNIIVTSCENGVESIQIVDFGIAKILPDGDEHSRLTQSGEVFGSPTYMSPEQCRGSNLDGRSDIYSIGCVMYESLVGFPPHVGRNMLEVLRMHLHDVPRGLSESLPPDVRIPARLEEIVFKALAKEPDQRYRTAAELKRDLEFVRDRDVNLVSRLCSHMKILLMRAKPRVVRTSAMLIGAMLAAITLSVSLLHLVSPGVAADDTLVSPVLQWKDNRENVYPQLVGGDTVRGMAKMSLESSRAEMRVGARTSAQRKLERLDELLGYGQTFSKHGCWTEALPCFKQALRIAIDVHGKSAQPVVEIRSQLANCYYNQNDMAKATDTYCALLSEPIVGGFLDKKWQMEARLADVYFKLHQMRKAHDMYERALRDERAHENRTTDDELITNARTLLVSKYADAVRLMAESVPKQKREELIMKEVHLYWQVTNAWKKLQGDNQNSALALFRLADAYQTLSELHPEQPQLWRQASGYYEKALALAESTTGGKSALTATVQRKFTAFLWSRGQYQKACLMTFAGIQK